MLIQRLLPRSDVMVHIDPIVDDEKSLVETIRSVAARNGTNVHSLQAHDVGGHMSIDMHAEVPDNLTVAEAHSRITELEIALKQESPELDSIIIHIEPMGDKEIRHPASPATSKDVQDEVKKLSVKLPRVIDCHNISIFHYGDELSITFHCTLAPNLPILEALHPIETCHHSRRTAGSGKYPIPELITPSDILLSQIFHLGKLTSNRSKLPYLYLKEDTLTLQCNSCVLCKKMSFSALLY
jgi:hypothetical protein